MWKWWLVLNNGHCIMRRHCLKTLANKGETGMTSMPWQSRWAILVSRFYFYSRFQIGERFRLYEIRSLVSHMP
jgi:hypothetical protein